MKSSAKAEVFCLMVCQSAFFHRYTLWGLVLLMSARSLVSTIIASCSVAVDITGAFWGVSNKDGFDEKNKSSKESSFVVTLCR